MCDVLVVVDAVVEVVVELVDVVVVTVVVVVVKEVADVLVVDELVGVAFVEVHQPTLLASLVPPRDILVPALAPLGLERGPASGVPGRDHASWLRRNGPRSGRCRGKSWT